MVIFLLIYFTSFQLYSKVCFILLIYLFTVFNMFSRNPLNTSFLSHQHLGRLICFWMYPFTLLDKITEIIRTNNNSEITLAKSLIRNKHIYIFHLFVFFVMYFYNLFFTLETVTLLLSVTYSCVWSQLSSDRFFKKYILV